MPASTIRLTKEFIINCVADRYNIDINKTIIVIEKDNPDYIEILWDSQEE